VFHKELHPSDFDSDEALKQHCYAVIQSQLLLDNPDATNKVIE
jgi:hypothetical protein